MPRPPTAEWPAERAVGVAAKAPTANPPTAPTAAPRKNLVLPSATARLLPASPSSTGASLAQRFAPKPGPDGPGYTWHRMLETGKRERLRGLPAVDAVLRNPAGAALAGRHGRAAATAAVRSALEDLRRRISAGEEPAVSEDAVVALAARSISEEGPAPGGQRHRRRPAHQPGPLRPLGGGRRRRRGGGHPVLEPRVRRRGRRAGLALRPGGAAAAGADRRRGRARRQQLRGGDAAGAGRGGGGAKEGPR